MKKGDIVTRKVLSLILLIVLLFNMSNVVFAMSSQNESNVAKNEFEVVELGSNHKMIYYQDLVVEDISTAEYRKIISKRGNDTSIFYEDKTTGIATRTQNGIIVETYKMNEERKKIHSWSMPEEDQILFKEYLSSQGGKRITSLPADLQDKYMVTTEKSGNILIGPKSDSNVKSLRSAAAIVRPAGTVYSAYPEYMQNEVASKSQYSSYCGRYLDMSIKDSMYNYVYIEEVSQTFEAMTTVCYIADFFNIAYDIAAGALGGYASLVGSVLTLDTRVKYYFKEAYMFSALRQANIYDYTNYYRDVSVLTEHGTGELCVNWDWDSNEGCYYNPRYAISGIAYPFTIAFATMYDNAQDIWEYNMYEYGYWQWGDV